MAKFKTMDETNKGKDEEFFGTTTSTSSPDIEMFSRNTTKPSQDTTQSTSQSTMKQVSIHKCVNGSIHSEQETRSFLTKSDLQSIAKLIAENVADNLGH